MGGLYQVAGACSPVGAEALEAGPALAWEQRALQAFFDSAPVLHRKATHIISERLHSMEERGQDLCTQPVPVRLARTLLRLMARIGRPAEGGVVLTCSGRTSR